MFMYAFSAESMFMYTFAAECISLYCIFVPSPHKAERGIWKCRASVRYFVSPLVRPLVRPSEICCKRSKIFIC